MNGVNKTIIERNQKWSSNSNNIRANITITGVCISIFNYRYTFRLSISSLISYNVTYYIKPPFSNVDSLNMCCPVCRPQAAPEVKVLSNLPSVNVEEVAPVSVSNVAMMAPEEILVSLTRS